MAALLYGSGFISQFIYNYQEWQDTGGTLGTSSPELPDPAFFSCLRAVFRFPSGLIGLGVIVAALAVLLVLGVLINTEYTSKKLERK